MPDENITVISFIDGCDYVMIYDVIGVCDYVMIYVVMTYPYDAKIQKYDFTCSSFPAFFRLCPFFAATR